ncbi:MAG TPA: thiamine phosphate synthase [Terriglobales bacterium]|nr:thiamine phosphate synthase [Terriglobales bacterium]
MILYYITDRRQLPGTEAQQRERLLAKIAEAARCGVDFIQLREKELSPRELVELARGAMRLVGEADSRLETRHSKLLVNSRIDVALAAGADGVHLTSTDIPASDARAIWASAIQNSQSETRNWVVAVSCHTPQEVRLAESHGADFAVFAPVFEKAVAQLTGIGLEQLRQACRSERRPIGPEGIGTTRMPVLALGGVTLENAEQCVRAGAAGVAGIRLFQENEIATIMADLRERRP